MSNLQIGLIHATLNSIDPLISAFEKNFPQVDTINYLDEGLLIELNRQCQLTENLIDRISYLLQKAIDTGVDGILLSCSSYSPAITELRARFPEVPVENVDDEMILEALNKGKKIGVVATVAAAGPTTQKTLLEKAKQINKNVEVFVAVSTEAFDALSEKDYDRHDILIAQMVHKLLKESEIDVVILAQLSMARALSSLQHLAIPVLTSPEISSKAIVDRVLEKG
ncbi:aspartate/glutamate racemase family protein [Neobacillus cucumis]|uniref:aspartate/glutamate racemase family protein n=1 Tax=Neobacillus cucumis TaxID=1740721 RepID=UPI002E1C9AFF|nr:aspartate/glutamate racemase family protein [Neobacillus cucumis]MED4228698.1 aspartate/glutamate racemase family protein [Neobacillus cucumis]